ncbi:MAG: SRPBCC family protein [Gemmataceae bacterium]
MILDHAIFINAPKSVVWQVTIDIERWPQWTPTVKSLKRLDQGPFACGSASLIQQPGLPEAKWVVTSLIPEERFTWESRILGMRMIATHELSTEKTGTRNVLRVEVSGILANLLSPLLRSALRRALAQENADLKARCESLIRE